MVVSREATDQKEHVCTVYHAITRCYSHLTKSLTSLTPHIITHHISPLVSDPFLTRFWPACFWPVSDPFLSRFWPVSDLFHTRFWPVSVLFVTCFLFWLKTCGKGNWMFCCTEKIGEDWVADAGVDLKSSWFWWFLTCFWPVSDLFLTCFWPISELFLTRFWPWLFLTRFWPALTRPWPVSDLFLTLCVSTLCVSTLCVALCVSTMCEHFMCEHYV